MKPIDALLLWTLSAVMCVAGLAHFLRPKMFVGIVPPFLPAPRLLVAVSGAAELGCGIGLWFASSRSLAAWGLVALLIAVFPANVYMAVAKDRARRWKLPDWALWARLPLQPLLVLWAWHFS